MERRERNRCLDFIKGLACIGVVFMHCTFPYPYGQVISFICKFAVPIFFMTSGYYAYNMDTQHVADSLKRKIKHILIILLCSEGLYCLIACISLGLKGKFEYWGNMLTLKKVALAIFFNASIYNGTLWFLYALLFGYILLYVINHFKGYRLAYTIVPVILLGHIILRTVLKKMNVEWYDVMYFRNAIFYALPMILLGNLIKRYEEKCCEVSNNRCITAIIGGIIITFIEYFLSRQVLDFYCGTLITAYFLFIFALKNMKTPFVPVIEKIGCNLSLWVYIMHTACITFSDECLAYWNIQNHVIIQWIRPFWCLGITLVLALTLQCLKKKIGAHINLRILSKTA